MRFYSMCLPTACFIWKTLVGVLPIVRNILKMHVFKASDSLHNGRASQPDNQQSARFAAWKSLFIFAVRNIHWSLFTFRLSGIYHPVGGFVHSPPVHFYIDIFSSEIYFRPPNWNICGKLFGCDKRLVHDTRTPCCKNQQLFAGVGLYCYRREFVVHVVTFTFWAFALFSCVRLFCSSCSLSSSAQPASVKLNLAMQRIWLRPKRCPAHRVACATVKCLFGVLLEQTQPYESRALEHAEHAATIQPD